MQEGRRPFGRRPFCLDKKYIPVRYKLRFFCGNLLEYVCKCWQYAVYCIKIFGIQWMLFVSSHFLAVIMMSKYF